MKRPNRAKVSSFAARSRIRRQRRNLALRTGLRSNVLTGENVQAVLDGNFLPLVHNIRAEAEKGRIKFTKEGFGRFVREILEHPVLGSGSLSDGTKEGHARLDACCAFVIEALTSGCIENRENAHKLSDGILKYKMTFRREVRNDLSAEEREHDRRLTLAAIEDFSKSVGEIDAAKQLIEDFRSKYRKSEFARGGRGFFEKMKDAAALGPNSEKIIKKRGIRPHRSYVGHLFANAMAITADFATYPMMMALDNMSRAP